MKIQSILFPEIGRCAEEELYFHFDKEIDTNKTTKWVIETVQAQKREQFHNKHLINLNKADKEITFAKGGCVWFDTYFNGLSIEKWMKYTVVDNVSVTLRLKGSFRVTLYSKEKLNDNIIEYVVGEYIAGEAETKAYSFDYLGANRKGMYTFKLEALQEGSVFYGGEYTANVAEDKVRDVKIGIGICTFRRESFVEKNLRILRETILENEASPMYGHLEVFVSDNGQTLDIERLSTPNIHMFPNRNLGGAGGFTRDLIEMLKANDKLHITHVLLMDDDIVIEPEALSKTYTVLTLLKDQYIDAFIGGAMLRLDKQFIQVEAGASWNGGALISNKCGVDLRLAENCLFNEFEEYTEFNAWWYCCFPITVVREDNLPLPIFIRGDDLEYGLRNMKHLILMNGICVWHEPFEYKYSSFLEYYITRNLLIDNSFHCPWYGKKQLSREIMVHCMREIMCYRYKNVDLYLQGVKDFLKGPEWLMQQDGEALHKQIMAAGYKAQELKELPMPFHYDVYENNIDLIDKNALIRISRHLTFNGQFLRAKGETVVPMAASNTAMFYRMKRVMHYDVASRKAFITEKKLGETFRCIFKTIGMLFTISFKLKKAQEAYRTSGMKLRTLAFWNEYLGLNQ